VAGDGFVVGRGVGGVVEVEVEVEVEVGVDGVVVGPGVQVRGVWGRWGMGHSY
jgi:hypothetical protein